MGDEALDLDLPDILSGLSFRFIRHPGFNEAIGELIINLKLNPCGYEISNTSFINLFSFEYPGCDDESL